jgi:hypothetical protein
MDGKGKERDLGVRQERIVVAAVKEEKCEFV